MAYELPYSSIERGVSKLKGAWWEEYKAKKDSNVMATITNIFIMGLVTLFIHAENAATVSTNNMGNVIII